MYVQSKKKSGWTGKNQKRMDSVWDINTLYNSSERKSITGYPTQKPIALLSNILQASSKNGDVVFDPFCGSGTTLITSELMGRQWIGVDINEIVIRVVDKRFREYANIRPHDIEIKSN